MAFHMLQCVYTVFHGMLRLLQEVVKWKMLNFSSVSQTYDQCRELLLLGIDEAERLMWGIFLLRKEVEIADAMT